MSFVDEIRIVWGPSTSQDPDALRQNASGRVNWLWDPPENAKTEMPYSHILAEQEDRKGCLRIGNPKQLEAWFYPIDRALIPAQTGGQCEGVLWFNHGGENLCWVEMKMNLITHSTRQFTEELEKALSQAHNTILAFHQRWEQQGLDFSSYHSHLVAIAVPAKPKRLRQAPREFQVKAKREMKGSKVFVLSEIELPQVQPVRGPR